MKTQTKILAATALTSLLATSPALSQAKDYDLATFTRIAAATNIKVTVRPGDNQSVTARAVSGNNLDDLQISVTDGELKLTTDTTGGLMDFIMSGGVFGAMVRGDKGFEIDIIVPELHRANASASAEVELHDLVGETFEAKASSAGEIVLDGVAYNDIRLQASSGGDIEASGTCTNLDTRASSGGDIEAMDLWCRDANARASSGGDIDLMATETVRARASSGGDIRIAGDARIIDQQTSSGGDVRRDK